MPSAAASHAPPLGPLDHAWRLAVCLVISGVFFGSIAAEEWAHHRELFWIDVALGALAYPLVVFRRRAPVRIALVIAVMSTLSGIAAGPATLAAVSVATRRRPGEVALVGLVNTACATTWSHVAPYTMAETEILYGFAATLGINVAMMGWGLYLGSRRELVWRLEQRALAVESEQDLRVGQARVTERTRIAREMHDVIAHRITQVSMQAGALAFREDLDAPRLRAGLTEIQTQANAALEELRSILGVLRDDATGEPAERPQPTFADIVALVGEARSGGTDVALRTDLPDGVEVPAPTGRALYRIVQEGITNARKHAPGERLHVRLSGDAEQGLHVDMWNRVPSTGGDAPGAGLGLIGLRERAELRGGHLAERTVDDTFEVRGWIPWEK